MSAPEIDPHETERLALQARREEAARAEMAAREADRPKLVVGILSVWFGVTAAGAGAIETASGDRGHQLAWLGLYLLLCGIGVIALWMIRAEARESARPNRYY